MKKIKGSLSKPEPTVLISIAALSLCALLPLRVYQVTTLIDPETGFFTSNHFTIPLMYAIGAAVIIALPVLSFLNSKANRARNCVVKSTSLGIISILTALGMTYDSIVSVLGFMQINSEYSVAAHNIKYSTYLTQSGAAALIAEGITGILAAFFFSIYAVSCFRKESKLSSFALISVTPTLWAISRIVLKFLEKISFVNISDLLLELIMLAFMIMFMLTFAQVVTGTSPEISAWRLFGCGLPAAVMAFITCVPRIFLALTGNAELMVEGYEIEFCDLALAIFIPVFLYNTATAKKTSEN
ncbi:MAG: hypothetical protein J6B25_00590 [Clostridia bacterium]|nr:hypothetical protein [Clostridia bacterium]